MHASKKHSPLLKNAPAYAQRTGLRAAWQNRRAFARGRRDAGSEPGREGFAAVQFVFRQVDLVAADIDGELQAALLEIDNQIHAQRGAAAASDQLHQELDAAAETQRGASAGDSVAALNAGRQAAQMASAAAAQDAQADAAEVSINALVGQRDRVHAAAGALLDSWAARANELAAHHARGYRQGRSPNPVDPYEPPRYPMPEYPWANGKQHRLVNHLETSPAETV